MGEAWLHNFRLCPHSHSSFSYQGSVTPDILHDEGTFPFLAPFGAYMFGDAVPETLLLLMFGLRRDLHRKRAALTLIRVEGDVAASPLSYELYVRLSPHTAQVLLTALYESVLNALAMYCLRLVTFPMESN